MCAALPGARWCTLAFYGTTNRSHVIATRSAAVMGEMAEGKEMECGISMGTGSGPAGSRGHPG